MLSLRLNFIERLLNRRSVARWAKAVKEAETAELNLLSAQRTRAQRLQSKLSELVHIAESRLALPRIGSSAFQRPGGTLWAWRPQLWRGPLRKNGMAAVPNKTKFGDELKVFHDCDISELMVRQLRNTREEDLAPFGLRLEVFRFDGSFLSLVLDLPRGASEGLQRRHLIRLNAIIETEKTIEIFARLNIKHGPNTEQVVLELPLDDSELMVEFDLAYTDLNEKRVEKMWVDLIFEGPEMNEITIRDLTFCRYPRAEL